MRRLDSPGIAPAVRVPALTDFTDVALWRSLVASDASSNGHQAWLTLFCAQIDLIVGPLASVDKVGSTALVAMGAPDSDRYMRVARFGVTDTDSLLLAKAAEKSMASRRAIVQAGEGPATACQITQPILIDDRLYGVVAVELDNAAQSQLEAAMRIAQWAIAWFGWRLRAAESRGAGEEGTEVALESIRRATSGPSVVSGSEALATYLAETFGLSRVAFGLQSGQKTRLLASSHGGFGEVRTGFHETLLAAMEEAADLGEPVQVPLQGADAAIPHAAHSRLLREHEADWALTIPVQETAQGHAEGDIICSLIGQGVPPEGLEGKLGPIVELASHILIARVAADASLSSRAITVVRRKLADLHFMLIGGGALAVALLAAIFVKVDYRVSGDATLEGVIRRSIVAPFDGYIAAAEVRPGDQVEQGARLVTLDDRELRLQRLDLEARVAETARQIDEALGQRDPAKVNILSARRDQIRAQLTEVVGNLERTELVAPFAGYIVSGDKSQSVGAPVRRGDTLYELSPLDNFRVAIDVPQAEFADVEAGQEGQLVLSSLPFDRFSFTIERLAPLATAHDGKTVFRVEARLHEASKLVRPGMQGVAHVSTGPRRLGWIYTHAALDWLRLKLWAWIP